MIDEWFTDGGTIIIDPRDDNIVYTGGTSPAYLMAIARSTDGGNSWTRSTITADYGFTYAIALDLNNPNILYAGGQENSAPALYKSTDTGNNWINITGGLKGIVKSIAIDPSNSNIIYVATDSGVHKSTDGGGYWQNTGCLNVRSVVVDPDQPRTIYAGTNAGFYLSTNGGDEWIEYNQGLPTKDILTLTKIPGSRLYAGTEGYSIFEWRGTEIRENLDYRPLTRSWFKVGSNPISKRTVLKCTLEEGRWVEIDLYDRSGRRMDKIYSGLLQAGNHRLIIDAPRLPDGVYFIKFSAGPDRQTRKIVVINR